MHDAAFRRLRCCAAPVVWRRSVERGQALVEFAVIFPLFVTLVFVMIDGGLLMGRYNQVNGAAQEGARLASTGATLSQIVTQTHRLDMLDSVPPSCSIDDERICVQWYDSPNGRGEVGSYVRVTVRYRYEFVTPMAGGLFNFIGFPDDIEVESCAMARLERPVSAGTIPSDSRGSGTPQC